MRLIAAALAFGACLALAEARAEMVQGAQDPGEPTKADESLKAPVAPSGGASAQEGVSPATASPDSAATVSPNPAATGAPGALQNAPKKGVAPVSIGEKRKDMAPASSPPATPLSGLKQYDLDQPNPSADASDAFPDPSKGLADFGTKALDLGGEGGEQGQAAGGAQSQAKPDEGATGPAGLDLRDQVKKFLDVDAINGLGQPVGMKNGVVSGLEKLSTDEGPNAVNGLAPDDKSAGSSGPVPSGGDETRGGTPPLPGWLVEILGKLNSVREALAQSANLVVALVGIGFLGLAVAWRLGRR